MLQHNYHSIACNETLSNIFIMTNMSDDAAADLRVKAG
jgi:hypothetical protein